MLTCFFRSTSYLLLEEQARAREVNKKRSILPNTSLVRRMRLELTRSCDHYPLKVACIPISPPALGCPEQDSNLHTSRHAHLKRTRLPIPPSGQKKRAENETRTRDPDLGKVVLYQLSYFRILFKPWYQVKDRCFSKAGAKVLLFFDMTKFF